MPGIKTIPVRGNEELLVDGVVESIKFIQHSSSAQFLIRQMHTITFDGRTLFGARMFVFFRNCPKVDVSGSVSPGIAEIRAVELVGTELLPGGIEPVRIWKIAIDDVVIRIRSSTDEIAILEENIAAT